MPSNPSEESPLKRYAFIDVANTKSTTKETLGFSIAWERLYALLTGEKWLCKRIFYYEGSMDDGRYAKRHEKLSRDGYVVKTKQIFLHKIKEKMARFDCAKCSKPNQLPISEAKFVCTDCKELNSNNTVSLTHNPKANFDVELTVDSLEYAGSDTEILIFTGDGDFKYLAEKLLEKGALVTFISTNKRDPNNRWRFSTRLKDLIREEEACVKSTGGKPRVRLIEIDNWKIQMQKENAAKRDVFER
ncbi:MAG: NYN domain-containing protein [bacterium]|nr:NYN domain-containing protein [bacterium]